MQLIMYPDEIAKDMKKTDEEEKKEELLDEKTRKKKNLNDVLQNILNEQMNCTKKMYEPRLSKAQEKVEPGNKYEMDESYSLSDESIDS